MAGTSTATATGKPVSNTDAVIWIIAGMFVSQIPPVFLIHWLSARTARQLRNEDRRWSTSNHVRQMRKDEIQHEAETNAKAMGVEIEALQRRQVVKVHPEAGR